MKKSISIIVILILIIILGLVLMPQKIESPQPGIVVPEVIPENTGNAVEKAGLIKLDFPKPNQTVQSPLTITGSARGTWFFEGSFPIVLIDWDGKIIAEGHAEAQGDWMTTEFVPFGAILTFTVDKNIYSNKGSIRLRKDNPSGFSENDAYLEIPIRYSTSTEDTELIVACTMDAKICPDGSGVGRVGPKCEFAPCPVTSKK